MSSFRKPQTILRMTPGGYVDGVFIPGVEVTLTIMASVQPVTGEDQLVLPAGKRMAEYVKAYTATQLQVLGEIEGLQPDRLVWRNKQYECIQADVRQMDVVPHYKYVFSLIEQS